MNKYFTSLVFLFAMPVIGFAQNCNNGSLRGAFAYSTDFVATVEGKTVTNSEVGRIVFDGNGGFTLKAASTLNGTTTVGEGKGIYAVAENCSFSGKSDPEGVDFDGVIVNNGNDFMFVARETGVTRPGGGTRIDPQQVCSVSSLNGIYGYQANGTIVVDGAVHEAAEIGLLRFNGNGSLDGGYSYTSQGTVERREFTGEYAINSDCTATLQYKLGDTQYVSNFVLAASGNTLLYSESGGGVTLTGQATRQVVR